MILLSLGTAVSWATWILVIFTLDPFSGGIPAHALFYGSFFLALGGTATIVGFFLRYWLEKEKILFHQIALAIRQGIEVALAAVIALILQSDRLLNVWTFIMLFVLTSIIEAFFLAGQARYPRSNS